MPRLRPVNQGAALRVPRLRPANQGAAMSAEVAGQAEGVTLLEAIEGGDVPYGLSGVGRLAAVRCPSGMGSVLRQSKRRLSGGKS